MLWLSSILMLSVLWQHLIPKELLLISLLRQQCLFLFLPLPLLAILWGFPHSSVYFSIEGFLCPSTFYWQSIVMAWSYYCCIVMGIGCSSVIFSLVLSWASIWTPQPGGIPCSQLPKLLFQNPGHACPLTYLLAASFLSSTIAWSSCPYHQIFSQFPWATHRLLRMIAVSWTLVRQHSRARSWQIQSAYMIESNKSSHSHWEILIFDH